MAVKFAVAVVLLVTASIFAAADAATKKKSCNHYNHSSGSNSWSYSYCDNGTDHAPKHIIVGGSEWKYGVDYDRWATMNGPFRVNDTLVFKYSANHSVNLLPDWNSYFNCDFTKSEPIAGTNAGAGKGFEYVLEESKQYFFACSERNGLNCQMGKMRFVFWSLPRW